MSSQRAPQDDRPDLLTDGFVSRRSELVRRAQEGVQHVVAAQLAAGHAVYSSGLGDEAGRLFIRTPDGRRYEYRVRANGVREVVHDDA